ncbi:hypothetical protein ACN6A1_09100 [Myxococcus virescens]|uniref:hypothetical protein n=1 Tax=Myxococcus virescens TaxID=83456 RepID=UPI003DA49B6D
MGIRDALLGGARDPVTPVQAVLEAGIRAQARGCSQSLDLTEEARAAFAADASS